MPHTLAGIISYADGSHDMPPPCASEFNSHAGPTVHIKHGDIIAVSSVLVINASIDIIPVSSINVITVSCFFFNSEIKKIYIYDTCLLCVIHTSLYFIILCDIMQYNKNYQ